MKKELYLFDFDGTLTSKDSLFQFLKFAAPRLSKPKYFSLIFILCLPSFFLSVFGFVKKTDAKQRFISMFIKNEEVKFLSEIANEYAKTVNKILRPKGVEKLCQLKLQSNVDVFIVSASLDVWLKPIADFFDVGLICTKAQINNNKFTGFFEGENCNGLQKVIRIKNEIDLGKYNKIIAFGDTSGDKEMLKIADTSFFKPFH